MKRWFAGFALASSVLASAPAGAATFTARDTLTYISPGDKRTFDGASVHYVNTITMPIGGLDAPNTVITLKSGQYDFYSFTGGTVSASGPNSTSVPTNVSFDIANGGGGGHFGFGYFANIGANFDESFITRGFVGNRRALFFSGGGTRLLDDGGTFTSTVTVDGNWSRPGSYADLTWNTNYQVVSPWFYNPEWGHTSITIRNSIFTQAENPNISFTLIGSAVPEPATWAMLVLGFGAIGAAARRRARAATA